jgi:DNA helicase-2/ATP-dependent DNA helicase PcrA
MLPSDRSSPARVQNVLDQLERAAEKAVWGISSYVDGTTCRHVALANHLGERLERCHTACDICAPRGERRVPPPSSPSRSSTPKTRQELGIDPSDPTFVALKAWRLEVARENEWPPYVVAYDRHLAEIARMRPTRPAELAAISGFGPKKVQEWGSTIVQIVAETAARR